MSGLISPADLAAALARHDDDVVVVDCRFNLLEPHAGFHAYLGGHVPGARYAHLDKDLSRPRKTGDGRHPLPAAADFAATLGAWGTEPDSKVVAYDDAGGAIAARLWWMLGWIGHRERFLLDGGLAAWVEETGALETEMSDWVPSAYRLAATRDEMIVETDEIVAMGSDRGRLLDARTAERYRGEREPIDAVAGHIPGSRSLPFPELMGPGGRFRPPAELREVFAARGVTGDGRDVVATCGSGVTACSILAALEEAGLGPGRLYVGSWSEWIADPSRPIETQSG